MATLGAASSWRSAWRTAAALAAGQAPLHRQAAQHAQVQGRASRSRGYHHHSRAGYTDPFAALSRARGTAACAAVAVTLGYGYQYGFGVGGEGGGSAGGRSSIAWAAPAVAAASKEPPARSASGGSSASGTAASGAQASTGSGRRLYTRAEVAQHKTPATRIWVTHGNGVYDVTDFVKKHPGGDKILLAAGGAVDPFWVVYAQHKTEHTRKILESMRIGDLDPNDVAAAATAAAAVGDPYANDPPRHPALIPRSLKPFNAEPPAALLPDAYLTPNDLFFVRNHLPVPDVKAETYVLEIDPGGGRPLLKLSLHDLRTRFPRHTVTVALQCAGNRRADMDRVKAARGLSWGVAAMANAEWTGARLRDVLAAAGVDVDAVAAGSAPGARHVQFAGLDRDPASGVAYVASVPADLATAPGRDAILAYEMNGAPLPRDHGYPVRAIVPGIVGARQVKWVGRVALASGEADSLWQTKDYKLFPPFMDMDNVDFSAAPAMEDMPVQSAICEPADGAVLPFGTTEVVAKGFAWAGGGRAITQVHVSPDGGATWVGADITAQPPDESPSSTRSWGWTLWEARLPVNASTRALDLRVKATDIACNTQPEHAGPVWNYRGLANNAWHRCRVTLEGQESSSGVDSASATTRSGATGGDTAAVK